MRIYRILWNRKRMAVSKFEYVRKYESDPVLLPDTWIVLRADGRGFTKFCASHALLKPNDERALRLMNRSALDVMNMLDSPLAFGHSDEYSFLIKKDSELYNRRTYKLISATASLLSSAYTRLWSSYMKTPLLYSPSFDCRPVLLPSSQALKDYFSWRQADAHVNNLYNTTFWTLVQKGGLTCTQAEERLRGSLSSDKNEILFSEFNINYNNELPIFKRGTILIRKKVIDPVNEKTKSVIVDLHDNMIADKFWEDHSEILENKETGKFTLEGNISNLVNEQLHKIRQKNTNQKAVENTILNV